MSLCNLLQLLNRLLSRVALYLTLFILPSSHAYFHCLRKWFPQHAAAPAMLCREVFRVMCSVSVPPHILLSANQKVELWPRSSTGFALCPTRLVQGTLRLDSSGLSLHNVFLSASCVLGPDLWSAWLIVSLLTHSLIWVVISAGSPELRGIFWLLL